MVCRTVLVFVLAVFAASCNGQIGTDDTEITLAPANTVHIRGNPNPVLECEMDFGTPGDGIQWIEYRTDSTQGYAVSLNSTILEGYETQYAIVNQFHLEILNPDVTAAAKYECRNLLAPQVRASAELAILESELRWETNASDYDYVIIEGEIVRYECSVEHSGGDWIPDVSFDNSQGGIEDDDFDCRLPADGENVVRQCVDILITQVSGDWIYTCEVSFPPPPIDGDSAADQNPPDFVQDHQFEQLDVHWAPRPESMVVDPPSGSMVNANEIVSCAAESNPPPTFYQWFDDEDEVIDFGADLLIPVECAGQEICITCLALNEMRDELLGQGVLSGCYNVTSIGVDDASDENKNAARATCFNPEMKRLRNVKSSIARSSIAKKAKHAFEEKPTEVKEEKVVEEKKRPSPKRVKNKKSLKRKHAKSAQQHQ